MRIASNRRRVSAASPNVETSSMPLEIVQIIQEFSTVGGAENVSWELARAFERLGISNLVLTSRSAAAPDAKNVRLVIPFTSSIPTRGPLRYIGRLLVVPLFTFVATFTLRHYRNAVAISHGDTLAGDILVVHAVNIENLHEKRRAGEWMWRFNPLHLWVSLRDHFMIGGLRYRRYVAVSPRVAGELKHHYNVPADRIQVIPNGIDVERFKPDQTARRTARARFGIPPDAQLLLFVGHEFDRKGLAHIIGAMERLGPEYWLLVVGAGDEGRYKRMASQLRGRVVFAGEQRGLESIYPAADAFVLPTAYETFSLVCMEAMACAVPVFATRVGGIEDYLVDGHNGFSIERDPNDVAAKLAQAFQDKEGLKQLAKGAYETALGYRWDAIATQYVALVEQVDREKKASTRSTGPGMVKVV